MHIKCTARLLLLLMLVPPGLDAQQISTDAVDPKSTEASRVEQRLDQVLGALSGMQKELDASKQQIDQLQNEIRDLRGQVQAANSVAEANSGAATLPLGKPSSHPGTRRKDSCTFSRISGFCGQRLRRDTKGHAMYEHVQGMT